ncbi:hypothetical protein H6G93_19715 [Nostoc sp. FACHB-973]|nr:hypothetical protein [Nostoc sp. FACHB-973]
MPENKKILFFSPYSAWLLHSQVDAIVAKALEMRDCEVVIILCDGVYKDCYITRKLNREQAINVCQNCSQTGQHFFESFGLPYLQLRNFITPDDYAIANEWIQKIQLDDYANAIYDDLPIGKWVISSIYTYFRISAKSLSRDDVSRVHKQYLIDGLVTYKAISRLLNAYQPTNLILFNGRIAPYRIAFEVAQQQKIDIITHERGSIADSFNFYDNSICLSNKPALDCVSVWENIPLKQAELLQVKQYFTNREIGVDYNWPAFYNFQTGYAKVRQKLRIPANAKIFTVFTSSEDEVSSSENYAGVTEQLEIIEKLINIFAEREEYLVVRHHPFIGGNDVTPPDTNFITRAYRQVLSAPKNVRIVMPYEQLTSYALLWHTDAAIAFFSTVSIEASARGIPTACFQISTYHKALRYFLDNQNLAPENLKQLVDSLLTESSRSTVEDFRKLYRFTHAYFFKYSTKFHSFGIKDSYLPDLRLESVDELQPGNDIALDRICDRILKGSFLYDISGIEDRDRSSLEEEAFLQQEISEIQEFSQKLKQQTLQQNDSSATLPVGVIYLRYQGEQDNTSLFSEWIRQSRHENIIVHCSNNLLWENYQDVIESIISIIEVSKEDYFLVTNSQYQYDESFISSSLEILLADEHQEMIGVLFGGWLATSKNGIQQQIFTERLPISSYQQAVEIFPLLEYPQTLLSFALMRSHAMVEVLKTIRQMPTPKQAAETLFTFFNGTGIHKTGIPMLLVHQSETFAPLSHQILNWVSDYQTEPGKEIAQINLRQSRKEIADLWLQMSAEKLSIAYAGEIGKAHQTLLDSGIKHEPLTDTEIFFVNELLEEIPKGFEHPKAIQYLLAGMLYCHAHQLPLQYECVSIPEWFLQEYFQFIFHSPGLFQQIGEVDNYYHYLQGWLDYLHSNIFSNPDLKLCQNIASIFTTSANFIPLYFSTKNLQDIYTKRADIMEFTLQNCGAEIDYIFPDRPQNRTKIRLGILNSHFTPHTETFHTLPAFEYLDRNQFEIILYTMNLTGHPLERYCQNCADRCVKLPMELNSRVETIRADDLDILLIGTNITAVTHQITLLGLHRLARMQVTFGSSPVTTGMRNIDYFISGSLSELPFAQEHYREKLITVDGPGYCFNYTIEPEVSQIKPERESWGIPENSVVFISGANFFKIIPELREIWTKILASVPNSVLVLYPFAPSWTNYYPANPFLNQMYAVLEKYGIDRSRLVVLDSLPSRVEVKECLKLADIYLDSPRHSGGHSLVDALEVGLPAVVMEGKFLRSRHAAAYLRELQLPELITDNEVDYINLSVELATNSELRFSKSQHIQEKMQANPRFFNSRDYSAQIGKLFQEVFPQHQASALTEKLKLRDINLIIFPDWSQPEDILYQQLASVIGSLVKHPDKKQITLLINIDNLCEDDINFFLSDVAMNLLLEEELDITDDPVISLVGQFDELQWKTIFPHIQARIVLEIENQEAIAKANADNLLLCDLDSLITLKTELILNSD